jgi:hypothetical protein
VQQQQQQLLLLLWLALAAHLPAGRHPCRPLQAQPQQAELAAAKPPTLCQQPQQQQLLLGPDRQARAQD